MHCGRENQPMQEVKEKYVGKGKPACEEETILTDTYVVNE